MAARRLKRPGGKPNQAPKPQPLIRLGLAPPLTAREVRALKARAAADLRTIGNYVSYLVVEELKRKDRRRAPAAANLGEKRRPYSIALYLTAAERKRLEAAARVERRSVSGYVARVVVGETQAVLRSRCHLARRSPMVLRLLVRG